MSANLLALAGFLGTFALMALRVPIGVALIAVGTLGFMVCTSGMAAFKVLAMTPMETAADLNFAIVPLFVVMGALARESGISTDLFKAASAWFGRLKGGLALSTIGACAGFSAVCGSSVAAAATMGRVAVPEMRRAGYDDRYATGVVAAGGTLGVLIPPSVPFVLYGFVTETDIGKLFMAGIVPGIVAVLLYMATVFYIALRNPAAMPSTQRTLTWGEKFRATRTIWPATLIFAAVIGGIYTGVCTPTEAAGVGAAATLLVALCQRRLDRRKIIHAFVESIRVSASLFLILIGAVIFGQFLVMTGAPQTIAESLTALPVSPIMTMTLILLTFIVLGCFLDTMAIILIFVPIVFPAVYALGFDPIWFGVLVVMVCEIGLITPPYGINVFVINSVAREVPLIAIFRGVIPFIVVDIFRVGLVVLVPALALWLPSQM